MDKLQVYSYIMCQHMCQKHSFTCSLALMFSVYSDVPFVCEHPNNVAFMPPSLQGVPHYARSKHAKTKVKSFYKYPLQKTLYATLLYGKVIVCTSI